jgi:type II secretory pathway pseudopilin PulG
MKKGMMKGQSLIELMLAIGLAALILPALLTGFVAARGGRSQLEQRLQANALVQEGQEAARVIREKDWADFAAKSSATCTTLYHPEKQSNSWVLANNSELIPSTDFTRQIQVCNVYRDFIDPNTPIVAQGSVNATLDQSTIMVKTTVSWTTPHPTTVSASEYLTRVANTSYTETSTSDFSGGTVPSSLAVSNTSGGEVILGPGSALGDWCAPSLGINSLDLPKNGVANGISAIEGQAVVGTGDNASGVAFAKVNISNPAQPASPAATLGPTYTNSIKTNGVFSDNSRYGYIATDSNGQQGVILDNAGGNYSAVGFLNAGSGSVKGNSIFVLGNIAYLAASGKLYAFDVTTKTGTKSPLGSVNLSGNGKKVIVIGTYAYVATDATTNHLQIINVQNPASMTVVSSKSMGNSRAGVDLAMDSGATTVYFVTANGAGNEFFIVDVTAKNNPIVLPGQLDTGTMNPTGIAYIPGGRAIVVGNGGEQYKVLRTTNNAPVRCGGITNPNGASAINAVAFVSEADGDVFSYILTNNSSKEFQVIAGGPGGSNLYAATGTFESKTFNAGYDVAFNRFSVTTTTSANTSISFKLAIKHGVSGSCTGVTFSPSDFNAFPPGPLPFTTIGTGYYNPGQCLRYQAILSTSDSNETPVLNDITFNYSL